MDDQNAAPQYIDWALFYEKFWLFLFEKSVRYTQRRRNDFYLGGPRLLRKIIFCLFLKVLKGNVPF